MFHCHLPLPISIYIQYMILIDIHVILVLFHWQKPLFTGWCVTPLVSESYWYTTYVSLQKLVTIHYWHMSLQCATWKQFVTAVPLADAPFHMQAFCTTCSLANARVKTYHLESTRVAYFQLFYLCAVAHTCWLRNNSLGWIFMATKHQKAKQIYMLLCFPTSVIFFHELWFSLANGKLWRCTAIWEYAFQDRRDKCLSNDAVSTATSNAKWISSSESFMSLWNARA